MNIKKRIESLGYAYKEVADEIILIKNFFNNSMIDPIWKIINSSSQDDWEGEYRQSQEELARRLHGREDLDNLINEGLMEYTYDWHDKSLTIPAQISKKLTEPLEKIFNPSFAAPFTAIQRQYEGAALIEHVDNHADPHIKFAAIGYLNDDYNGGNLVFPKLEFKIKPEKNSLLIFPSGEKYLHGVEAPLSGPVRYVLPTFIF